MTIEVCGWRIEPYQTNGKRCWQLMRKGRKTPERYYDDLGRALRFIAGYALRDDEPGVMELDAALDRYERLVERIEEVGRTIQ